jgi:hypothetical protein
MMTIWNSIKSIFVNDAHEIVSAKGKILLAEEDSWEDKLFKEKVRQGVESLAEGKTIQIFEYPGSRSYELALEIKREYLLMKQRELVKKINVDKFGSTITIKWDHAIERNERRVI